MAGNCGSDLPRFLGPLGATGSRFAPDGEPSATVVGRRKQEYARTGPRHGQLLTKKDRIDDSIPFEFFSDGLPASQQARRRSRCQERKDEVHRIASQSWYAEQPVEGPVAVTITPFFDGESGDINNRPKPILDALMRLVYVDDSQVCALICRKRALTGDLQIQSRSADLHEYLTNAKQFLYIPVVNSLKLEFA